MTSDVEERLRTLERLYAEILRRCDALEAANGQNTQAAALLRSAATAS